MSDHERMREAAKVLTDIDDAALMTKMGPTFAILVAEWLVATAHDVEHINHPVYNLTSTVVARARKVTDEILGADLAENEGEHEATGHVYISTDADGVTSRTRCSCPQGEDHEWDAS